MTTAAKLAGNLSKVGAELARNNRNATKYAALAFKDAALTEAKKDSGGDLRLSHFGKKGAKLSVGFDLDGDRTARATVRPRPMGPWKVLQYGAKPHLIVPGLTRRQAKALSLFSAMAGQGGSLDSYNIADLASSARGNRNNKASRRRKRRPPLKIGGQMRAWASHPGVAGKHTWTRAESKGADQAIKGYRANQARALGKVFG